MANTKPETIKPVIVRSAIVACVVGPTLTVINQFDAIFGSADLDWVALALTMCVPFCVSAYSGLLSRRQLLRHLSKIRTDHADALAKQKRDSENKLANLQETHAAAMNTQK